MAEAVEIVNEVVDTNTTTTSTKKVEEISLPPSTEVTTTEL